MTGPPVSDPLRLADRLALRELVEDYAHHVDHLELAEVAALFTPDGLLEITTRDGVTAAVERRGRDAIAAAMEGLRRYGVTAHHLAQQSLRFDPADPDRATAETYCTAHHVRVVDDVPIDRVMMIRYLDTYVRVGSESVDGRWRIEHRRLVVDLIDEHPNG